MNFKAKSEDMNLHFVKEVKVKEKLFKCPAMIIILRSFGLLRILRQDFDELFLKLM